MIGINIDPGYLAGLIDGDGSIGILKATKGQLIPYLIITNTDKSLMNFLSERLFEFNPIVTSHQGWRKICYQIRFQGLKLLPLFQVIHSHLLIKKLHCEGVIDFIVHRCCVGNHVPYNEEDKQSFERLRILNQRSGRNHK